MTVRSGSDPPSLRKDGAADDAGQNMQKSRRFLVPWADICHQSMPFMISLLNDTYTLEVLIYLTSHAMSSQVGVMYYTLFQPLIFKSKKLFDFSLYFLMKYVCSFLCVPNIHMLKPKITDLGHLWSRTAAYICYF
jgi:hypothetical protein